MSIDDDHSPWPLLGASLDDLHRRVDAVLKEHGREERFSFGEITVRSFRLEGREFYRHHNVQLQLTPALRLVAPEDPEIDQIVAELLFPILKETMNQIGEKLRAALPGYSFEVAPVVYASSPQGYGICSGTRCKLNPEGVCQVQIKKRVRGSCRWVWKEPRENCTSCAG